MQYYTKQQITGGPRYTGRCIIGNWNEDFERTDSIIREVLSKKMTGTLKLDSFQTKLQNSLAPLDLAPQCPDGIIRFGELVLALGIGTSAALSVSVDQANRPHCVTGGRGDLATPCGRSTFYLERYECARPSAYEPLFEGDALRYGSKFRLVVNPATRGEEADPSGGSTPTYLFSRPISSDFAAKHSKHQYVGLTTTKNYDTVWQVLAVDPAQRGLSEGLEVTVGAPVVLVHCATNQALCIEDTCPITTDFGAEYEVSAYNTTSFGHLQSVTKVENNTARTKAPLHPNVFVFLNGAESVRPEAEEGGASAEAPAAEAAQE